MGVNPLIDIYCRVSVAPECVQAFNDLKLKRAYKFVIFKISDDWKEIVVEETSKEADYEVFRNKLLKAKSKNKKGEEGIGGRYAVYDVEYEAAGGAGQRNKIAFLSFVPDDASQYVSILLMLRRSRHPTRPTS